MSATNSSLYYRTTMTGANNNSWSDHAQKLMKNFTFILNTSGILHRLKVVSWFLLHILYPQTDCACIIYIQHIIIYRTHFLYSRSINARCVINVSKAFAMAIYGVKLLMTALCLARFVWIVWSCDLIIFCPSRVTNIRKIWAGRAAWSTSHVPASIFHGRKSTLI